MSSQKPDTSFSQSVGSIGGQRGLTGLSQGVDFFFFWKQDVFIDGVPGARAGNYSLAGRPHPQTSTGLAAQFHCCLELGLRWQVLEVLVTDLNLSVRKIALLRDIHREEYVKCMGIVWTSGKRTTRLRNQHYEYLKCLRRSPIASEFVISISIFHFNWALVPMYAFLNNADVWYLFRFEKLSTKHKHSFGKGPCWNWRRLPGSLGL